jgi:glycosyltransferase involved in cell wall biosynthesis
MTDPRPPLSCYIRTLNEARMIVPVVQAALTVAREVVIVDSGSTDGTRRLAEEAGARVVDQPWLGNGAQKRAGEDACRHDWVLDLDADEVVTPEFAAAVAALFAPEPPLPVYRVTLLTQPPYGPLWRGFNHVLRAKLYDRRRFRMPDSRAWDQLDIPRGTPVGLLKAPLIHHPFINVEHKMTKLNRISSVRARETKMRSRASILLRVWLGLPFYILKHLLQRGLWRAGSYGFVMAVTAGIGRWLRDAKMLERSYDAEGDGKE